MAQMMHKHIIWAPSSLLVMWQSVGKLGMVWPKVWWWMQKKRRSFFMFINSVMSLSKR